MKPNNVSVSGPQFLFVIACFIQASSLLTSFIAPITMQDSWMVVLLASVVFVPVILLYQSIMQMFPDQNLVQILETVFGKAAGKLVAAVYLWFFLTLSALNVMDMTSFLSLAVMTETPNIVLTVITVVVAAWAVKAGLSVVVRYGFPFVIAAFLLIVMSIIFLNGHINLQNFLPMLEYRPMRYIQGTHVVLTIPFGELVCVMMINPALNLTKKEMRRYWLIGFGLGAITLLLIVARDISALGNVIELFIFPPLTVLQIINAGTEISRLEILFATVLIMLSFFKISFLYYVSVSAVTQIFNLKSAKRIIYSVGAFIVVYGTTLYKGPVNNMAAGIETAPVAWTVVEVLIPIVIFVTAKLRGFPRTAEETA